MPTIRCYPNDVVTLNVKNKGLDGGVYPDFFPSATPPTWDIDDHAVAEFSYMSPDQHTVKVLARIVGTAVVTATLDTGDSVFTLNVVAVPTQTLSPTGDYKGVDNLRTE